jgi:hypothetical protein
MKTFKQIQEDIGLSVGGPGLAMMDLPMGPPVSRSKFAGFDVFDVDEQTFHRCRLGKIKYKHWKTFVGEDTIGKEIREYANRNFRKPIILKSSSGAMLFVRGNHLDFNKRKR